MKAYVITTAVVFVLITLSHIARLFAEGPHLLKQPVFVLTSILALALVVWAGRVFRLIPPVDEKA
jgi:hypothetical protein